MPDGCDKPLSILASGAAVAFDARLAVWLSPAFPTGAFAYSHGLEWAAERGWIGDRATLATWLEDLLVHGAAGNDLILLAAAARAFADADLVRLDAVNALALALQPSAERYLETAQQGTSFLHTVAAAWPCDGLEAARAALGAQVALPVALGVAATGHGIALPATLHASAQAFVTNLVSAAIRLSVVGQTDGQRIIAGLMPTIAAIARRAEAATLDDLGACTLRSDIASLAHETQYTRLFRS